MRETTYPGELGEVPTTGQPLLSLRDRLEILLIVGSTQLQSSSVLLSHRVWVYYGGKKNSTRMGIHNRRRILAPGIGIGDFMS